jgi:general stress protein YciG
MSGMGKSKRGFASMDVSRQREIASKGGRAAHQKGTAHEWTSDEARVAGRKGGEVVSRDRAHMAAIGREGGESRGAKNRRRQTAASRGSEATGGGSGGAYSDRESPVEVSREGMSSHGASSRGSRDELSDDGMESVRDEDVPNPT